MSVTHSGLMVSGIMVVGLSTTELLLLTCCWRFGSERECVPVNRGGSSVWKDRGGPGGEARPGNVKDRPLERKPANDTEELSDDPRDFLNKYNNSVKTVYRYNELSAWWRHWHQEQSCCRTMSIRHLVSVQGSTLIGPYRALSKAKYF